MNGDETSAPLSHVQPPPTITRKGCPDEPSPTLTNYRSTLPLLFNVEGGGQLSILFDPAPRPSRI
jgi:hypothetical protein